MTNKQQKILTIIGNVGAGKTSALDIATSTLNADLIDADDLFQTSNPFAKRYLKNLKRWSFTNETWMTLARGELIQAQIEKSDRDWIVIDSGMLMSRVYTYSHLLVGEMDADEWNLYCQIYNKVSEEIGIDVVVRLKYSLSTLMKRIKQRGRDYELEFYTNKYLEQLEQSIDHLVTSLPQQVKVITVDEQEIADFVNKTQDRKALTNMIINTLLK